MKYILSIIILFTIVIQAQDIPSGYTTNLRLRLYDLDDYPGADSLNANAQLIDAGYKRNRDSLAAHAADLYSVAKYSGGLKTGVVTNASLATEVDTSRLKTTGNDAVYGSKYFYSTLYSKTQLPVTTKTWSSGTFGFRWRQVNSEYLYADYLILANPTDTIDTAVIDYDGTKISFDKPINVGSINITNSVSMDSATSLDFIRARPIEYIIDDVADSIIIMDSVVSIITLQLPGNVVTPGIEKITMNDAAEGTILIFYSVDGNDSVTFRDAEADGNLQMEGDFTLRKYDSIEFMFIADAGVGQYYWIEQRRKNN